MVRYPGGVDVQENLDLVMGAAVGEWIASFLSVSACDKRNSSHPSSYFERLNSEVKANAMRGMGGLTHLCLLLGYAANDAPDFHSITPKEETGWKEHDKRVKRRGYRFLVHHSAFDINIQGFPQILSSSEQIHERKRSGAGLGNLDYTPLVRWSINRSVNFVRLATPLLKMHTFTS
ncbi:hypothetical protein BDV32DRAFT_126136 [Aspergillus pseudonomiae]|nr:hypothetical protein BDV32DRAFT_126136 [Aspergillus pseudonomiae]